ncbi:hypothetical protein [Pseudidiomarina terrestris]|uniref:hypothetical protein n=1 Tax=Pseudidiomarina terrestris TaxID=2820060 RepID=UPI00264BCB33|nr:hypothetical protein [Pseudidiomarina sp. 1ASP75-5]MDN7135964.1 hypothetical protein [Pseudidiomarina sp. 1ASP75-5]
MKTKLSSSDSLLRSGLDSIWQNIYAQSLRECQQRFKKWSAVSKNLEGKDEANQDALQLVLFLQNELATRFKTIEQLRTRQAEFNYNYHQSASEPERTEHLVSAAKYLGYPARIVRKIATNKLDWFDDAAISEYFEKRTSEHEKFIVFVLGRLCEIVRLTLVQLDDDEELKRLWQLMALPEALTQSLSYQAQATIRIAACRGLRVVLQEMRPAIRDLVPSNTIQYVYRTCLDKEKHIWMRAEMMTLIAVTQPSQYLTIFQHVYAKEPDADIFLKARMVESLLRFVPLKVKALRHALRAVRSEPSEYVRQRFAESTQYVEPQVALRLGLRLLQSESSNKVKAQFLLTLLRKDWTQQQLDRIVESLLSILNNDDDVFLLRTVFHVLPHLLHRYLPRLDVSEEHLAQIDSQLTWLNHHHDDTRLRRWAAECREAIFFYTSASAFDTRQRENLERLPLEASLTLKADARQRTEAWYRQMAYMASKRFGFNVRAQGNKLKIWSGFRFRPRLWRMIHEWRKPATDKRQNHSHTKGRVYYGLEQFNSRIVAEQSITKVPGEPVYISEEAGERSYLPLVDQLISCLDQGWPTAPMRIYSSEGVTEVLPPKSLLARLRARWKIQLQFARFSRLRNWQEGDSFAPNAYLKKVSQLGFKLSIRGYADNKGNNYPVEPRVNRFFPAVALPFTLPSMSDVYNYFYSVYQNTITQLLAFTSVVFVGFFANHVRQLVELRRHRKRLPLVIGGWGTRGKSGTERLKAAVFNELGLSVLSKTTGCEAMFLYGNASRPMKELFLFRPYDKATIWEQVFLTKFASKLNVDVFLWECMGLTPRYIEILQSQWMRDDISTITNCYPDHEDIQGPAGIEIPIVMQNFIAKKGDVYTTEESMLPLLQDEAHRKQANLTAVTWLDSGLITEDVLKRFPYAEHPNNIALVRTMSKRLGVRNDVAVKAMADNVIADLGVLKIYPTVPVQGRNIEFVNGMSANERLGALSNWQRTGFNKHNLVETPDVWTGIVVNNRADRVARSQVFAEILVSDMQADRYYFIGDNLDGLQTYISDAWQNFVIQFKEGAQEDQQQQLTQLCKRFRIATEVDHISKRIGAALRGINVSEALVDELLTELPQWQSEADSSAAFARLQEQTDADNVDREQLDAIRQLTTQMHAEYQHWQQLRSSDKDVDTTLEYIFNCFKERWVVVENYYSTGNETVQCLIDTTPPGLQARVIGVQNIKGTGLDFIYRWQAWDKVHSNARILRESRDLTDIQAAARVLATWQEYGVLDAEFVEATVAIARERQICQQESIQADLRIIEQQLKRQQEETAKILSQSSAGGGWQYKVLRTIEAFLDSGNAIKRRKTSNAIYDAMLKNTISTERATVELAALNKAQKGDWLVRLFKRKFADKKNL